MCLFAYLFAGYTLILIMYDGQQYKTYRNLLLKDAKDAQNTESFPYIPYGGKTETDARMHICLHQPYQCVMAFTLCLLIVVLFVKLWHCS